MCRLNPKTCQVVPTLFWSAGGRHSRAQERYCSILRAELRSTYFCDLVGIEHNEVAGRFVFPEDMDAARNLLETAKLPHADPLMVAT